MVRATSLAALVATAAVAFVVAAAAPASAFAPVNSPLRAAGPMSFAQERPAFVAVTRCANQFTGHVTVDGGAAKGGEASIDSAAFTNCDSGVAVTPRSLPWTLTLTPSRTIAVRNVDIDITTQRGTCRYSGDLLNGFYDNTLGLYNLNGVLSRRSSGCGVGDTLGIDTGFQELILINNTGMTL